MSSRKWRNIYRKVISWHYDSSLSGKESSQTLTAQGTLFSSNAKTVEDGSREASKEGMSEKAVY